MTLEICCEARNTNPNSIYIPINVNLEGYYRYELCAYIDSDCVVCLKKKTFIFRIYVGKSQQEFFTSKDT